MKARSHKPGSKESKTGHNDQPVQKKNAGPLARFNDNRPEASGQQVLQAMANDFSTSKTIQPKANKTGLPDGMKSGIENLSGLPMDDVKVHYNSSQPAQLNAHAYAQGTDIHVAPGQEKHLAHEAWHVVQQKQGRVKPTMQMKGKVNVNDDRGLEKEADVMGAKALQAGAGENKTPVLLKSDGSGLPAVVGEPVVQRVGGEKISFERTKDFGLWRGLGLLDTAINEMKTKRHQKKEEAWADIGSREDKNDISSAYSGKLEDLKDDEALIRNTAPFTSGQLLIAGDKVKYVPPAPPGFVGPVSPVEIATILKGNKAFSLKKKQPKGAQRQVHQKGEDEENEGEYIKDDRNVMTRRYAYVEKNYWQFMEFLHTNHMEGRYQKFIRAAGGGNGRPDVLNNDNPMVKKTQRVKGQRLSLEQLAFTHQYWGSGSQQRGLSLTSTPKPGVTIGNAGENFRTDGGFRIKIDLSRIPTGKQGAILLNHYAHGGVKDTVKDQGGPVETNPLQKPTPYKYHSSVVKNRELYLEHLKPEWIVEIERHPSAAHQPGKGGNVVHKLSDHENTAAYMEALKADAGADDYGVGFAKALAGEKKPAKGSQHLKNGFSSGEKYLEGYDAGRKELVALGTKRAMRGTGKQKANTKKDWSESSHKKGQRNAENDERTSMHIANLTLENSEHDDKSDIYRVGYIHGRSGAEKIKALSDLKVNA